MLLDVWCFPYLVCLSMITGNFHACSWTKVGRAEVRMLYEQEFRPRFILCVDSSTANTSQSECSCSSLPRSSSWSYVSVFFSWLCLVISWNYSGTCRLSARKGYFSRAVNENEHASRLKPAQNFNWRRASRQKVSRVSVFATLVVTWLNVQRLATLTNILEFRVFAVFSDEAD